MDSVKSEDLGTAKGMLNVTDQLIAGVLNKSIDNGTAKTVFSAFRTKLSIINCAVKCRKAGLVFENPAKALPDDSKPEEASAPNA